MIMLVATMFVSCWNRNGGDNGGDTYDVSHNIMFSMSVDDNTRGGDKWKDDYTKEIGNTFEKRILPDALRVAIYTTGNVKLGEVQDIYYWPNNEEMTEYKFMGTMPDAFTSHFMNAKENGNSLEYKIMVMANCPEGDEADLTYHYSCLDRNSGAIPMWGIKKVNLSGLTIEQSEDIGEIKLLRSAAKLEVKLSDALKKKGTVINEAYVNYYNQTGYCLPTGWDEVERTEELSMTDCFRLYRHVAPRHDFTPNDDNTVLNVYVPEYDNSNINYAEGKAKISLDITHNGERRFIEDAISLCQYSNGSPVENSDYNIVRNHIYQYKIVKITGEDILLEYSVADWDLEDWGDGATFEEHDLAYPTYHNPVVPKSFFSFVQTETTPNHIIKETPVMYYNSANPKAGAFECYFQITAPTGVQWKPNMMGSKENYTIQVYDANNVLVFDSDEKNVNINECASNAWYKILVYPKNDNGVGTAEVDFGIVYWQSWSSSYINLYINGEYNNIKWPDSGDNPKLISIKHIEQPTE